MHGVSLLEVRGLEGARTIAKNEVRLTHFSRDNEFFVFGTDLFGRGHGVPPLQLSEIQPRAGIGCRI